MSTIFAIISQKLQILSIFEPFLPFLRPLAAFSA